MRLRRETGDFQIKVTSGAVNTIRKGLSAEDFVGELVSVDGVYEVISSASDGEGTVTAKSETYTLTYNKETGAIAAQENSGGSGSGAITLTGNATYGGGLWRWSFEPIAAGLTPADLLGAKLVANYSNGNTDYGFIVAARPGQTYGDGDAALTDQIALYDIYDWYAYENEYVGFTNFQSRKNGGIFYDPATGQVRATDG